MPRFVYRFLLWVHDDLTICRDCRDGELCEEAFYLRRRAGLRIIGRRPQH